MWGVNVNKKYVKVFSLVLAASVVLTAHSTFAADNAAQPSAGKASTSATVTGGTATDSTAAGTTSADSNAASSSDATIAPADTSTLKLSLEDAQKYAEENNNDLKLTDSKIKVLEKQNDEALGRHKASTGVTDEDSQKDKELNYKRTQWNLDNANHDRETQLKNLKVQVTNEYENILTLQQQEDNLKKELDNLNTTIDQINLQIKIGLKVPSEIYSYNASKSRLEAGIKGIENSINSSMITLKRDLGIDMNREVVLTSAIVPYTKFDDKDLDNRIAKAIKTNYDIQKNKQDIDISHIEYTIDKYYDDPAADQIELSIEDKKATLDRLPANQELSLRTAYNSLKTLEDTIEADKLAIEADQINIDVLQKKIDAGTASSLEMIALKNKLIDDQTTLQKDINAYMTASANFQNSLENN